MRALRNPTGVWWRPPARIKMLISKTSDRSALTIWSATNTYEDWVEGTHYKVNARGYILPIDFTGTWIQKHPEGRPPNVPNEVWRHLDPDQKAILRRDLPAAIPGGPSTLTVAEPALNLEQIVPDPAGPKNARIPDDTGGCTAKVTKLP